MKAEEKRCRETVFNRAGGRCEKCGKGYGLSYHHRQKRSAGGKWAASNIVLICGSGTTGDHGWCESHPNEASEIGFHVRPWETPADKPILIRGSFWALLDESGGYVIRPDN